MDFCIIIYGRVANSKNFDGLLRPEQHWYDTQKCRYSWGNTCRIAKVIVPTSCRTEIKRGAKSAIKVFCRKCDKFNVEVQSLTADDQKSLDSRAKHMGYLTSHEANCGSK